ncbi:uncharacterized protein V1518DRAFT_410226 [Limtongia smithiae]|uniref:uncharacterized protein n=1 Tax=Limtongia smithiae TaxID=1125753 RepID=UPI0034CF3A6F
MSSSTNRYRASSRREDGREEDRREDRRSEYERRPSSHHSSPSSSRHRHSSDRDKGRDRDRDRDRERDQRRDSERRSRDSDRHRSGRDRDRDRDRERRHRIDDYDTNSRHSTSSRITKRDRPSTSSSTSTSHRSLPKSYIAQLERQILVPDDDIEAAEDAAAAAAAEDNDAKRADRTERERRERDARSQALTLEILGDLPYAEVKPPENVLFVAKLNPVTESEDLQTFFSQCGPILSCEVIRDRVSGKSLQYAFIEYENRDDCERAYFKMQDALIDDSRVHVDFSQSVSGLQNAWRTATNRKRASEAASKARRSSSRSTR